MAPPKFRKTFKKWSYKKINETHEAKRLNIVEKDTSNLPIKFRQLAELEAKEDSQRQKEEAAKKPVLRPMEVAQNRFEQIQQQKAEAREKARIAREERQKRIREAQAKREKRNKLMMKTTRKGQPLMKARMEVLLGDIEELVKKRKKV